MIEKAISFQEFEGSGYGVQVAEECAAPHRANYKQNVCYRKTAHPTNSQEGQGYADTELADTLNGIDQTEARTPTLVCHGNGNCASRDIVPTITGDHQDRVTDYTALCIVNGQTDQAYLQDKVGALNCMHDQQAIAIGFDRASYNQGKHAQFDFSIEEEKIGAQTAKGPGAVCQSVVRRLTPLECTRLQGYPDRWVDIGEWVDTKGKKHKDADAPKYKALGNSICLPFWKWLLKRISAQYERDATLGSLFSGIGGFDLCWERINGKGSCRWQSEVDEFCIAVCKKHFGDEEGGIEGDWNNYT